MVTAQKKQNYWQYVVYIAAGLALFMWGRSCGIGSVIKTAGIDTTVSHDSIITRYKPVPWKIKETDTVWLTKKVKGIPVHDTIPGVYEVRIESADTAEVLAACLEIARNYYQKRYYDTTIKLKRGSARIKDTVWKNEIIGREVNIQNTDTIIRKTIVLQPPQKIVLSFTVGVMGNIGTPLYGYGGGFTVKLPKGNTYGIKANYIKGDLVYQIEAGIPIHINLFNPFKKIK